MKQHSLGNTDILVSSLGLGTVKFGRNQQTKYPCSFALPTDKQITDLLALAKSLEINLLDTAPAYGTSEERLGQLLSDRHDWVLCTKVGENFTNGISHFDFSKQAVTQSIENSLKKLRTDYLDIVLIHSNGDDINIIEKTDIFTTLAGLKEKGLIRAFGMSTKTIEGGKLAVDHSDIVMVTYNPIHTEEKPVIEYAHQHNKAVFIKKALASGHLTKISQENPVTTAIDFIFKTPGISSIIVGTLNLEHLKEIAYCANLHSK